MTNAPFIPGASAAGRRSTSLRTERAERELRLLQAITQEVSAADDFRSALQAVMAKVCQAAGWRLGQAWIPCADGTALEWAAATGEDDPPQDDGLERFREVSRAHLFGPGQGLPGACWQSMRPVWRKDLTDSATFPRAAAACQAHLASAIAAPVLADGKVVAVIEFFATEARDEDEQVLGLLQTISTQLGWLIQRKRAEDALRESEQRFRQLADTINEVFWLADPPSSKMLYVSPAYEEIFGRSRESLYRKPRSWTDAVHAEDRAHLDKIFLAKAQEQPLDETYRIVRPDGSVRWIRDRGYPVRDSSGKVYRFAGVAQDVTDGKLAEQERERRVRQLQALADAAQAIGAADSLDEITTAVRNGARRIIGAHLSTRITIGDGGRRSIHARWGADRPGTCPAPDAALDDSSVSRLVRDTNRPLRLTRREIEVLPAWAGSRQDAGRRPSPSGILAVPLVGRDGKNLGLIRLASAELWAEEDGWLALRVEDCGRGFEMAAALGASSGLTGMGERARLLGGSLSVESRPGAGTRLLARLPVAGGIQLSRPARKA